LKIVYTTQFKKDFKKVSKQGKDLSRLESVIETLLNKKTLEPKYKDHPLTGRWKNHRDCHIQPDWLLIYRIKQDSLILERTGSHSDLFK